MTIDVIIGSLLLVMLVLGWRSGALAQVLRMVAIFLAIFGAKFVSTPLQELLFGADAELSAAVELGSVVLGGVLIYFVISVSAWLLTKGMRAASEQLSRLDRGAGALLGAVKAALLGYVIMSLVVLLKVPMEKLDPANALHLRGGHVMAFVDEHNILAPWSVPDLATLHEALRVRYYAEELGREQVVRSRGGASDLLRQERVVALAEDTALMQAVLTDQYAFTLADPRVRALLDDAEFVERLVEVDWSSLLEEVQSPLN